MLRSTSHDARGLAAAAALALLAAACSRPTLQLDESQTYRDATRTQTVEAYVPEGTEELELAIELAVERGTVAFRVSDPLGVVQWQGELTSGGNFTDQRGLDPVVGTWRLDFEMVGASGSYEARGVGRSALGG
jgi:hypothetical protein